MSAAEISLTLPDGSEVALRETLRIGRDAANDLVLASRTVSRHHALITFRHGRWWIEDRGSFNGTLVNGTRVQPGAPQQLRHADQIQVGTQRLLFSWPAQVLDADATQPVEEVGAGSAELSPLQKQVLQHLCGAWLAGANLESLPSNEEIAAALGTPGATGTVKAALRRIYAKAGLSAHPSQEKRRAVCRVARQRGWL